MTIQSAGIVVEKRLIAIQTIAAADIAAKLYLAQNSAARLSLTAKNLSVIAARIDLDATSLKNLSSFYDQLVLNPIKRFKEINFL